MTMEIRRIMDRKYMVLINSGKEELQSDALKMVLRNRISGLLPVRKETLDETEDLLYDITGLKSLEDILKTEPVTQELLRRFVISLKECTESLHEYLLDVHMLVLTPERIYLDPDSTAFFFCFCPCPDGNPEQDLRDLFDQIIETMDYGDPGFVKQVFEMHILVQNDNFSIRELAEVMEQPREDSIPNVKGMFEPAQEPPRELPARQELPEPEGTLDKVRRYLRGKGIREVITDIDQGTFLQKLKEAPESVPKTCLSSENINSRNPVKPLKPENSLKPANSLKPSDSLKPEKQLSRENSFNGGKDSFSKSEIAVPSGARIREVSEKQLCQSISGTESDRRIPDSGRTRLLRSADLSVSRLVGTGKCSGDVIEISHYPFLIGKLPDEMDVILDSPSVSRMHARILKEQGSDNCLLEDFNSTNGTFVNGRRIEPYRKIRIRPGDRIRLADREFILE